MHVLVSAVQWAGMLSGWTLWALCLLKMRPRGHKHRQLAARPTPGILADLGTLNAAPVSQRPRPHRAGQAD